MTTDPSTAPAPAVAAGLQYSERREHELRKSRVVMIDGALTQNSRSSDAGTSVRVYRDGYWGFASQPGAGVQVASALERQAIANAAAMSRFGARDTLALPAGGYRGEHAWRGRAPLSAAEVQERLTALNAWCRQSFPGLTSVRFIVADEHHSKRVVASTGADSVATIQRASLHVVFVAPGADGAPVELVELLSGKGHLGDLDWSLDALAPRLQALHVHLRAKCQAVPARGGLQTVVLAAPLAGMLAHEAMGHPCEADIVLGGAVTGGLLGRPVASELVSMVDYAHHVGDEEVMIPVYADDEGTPAEDAVLIRDGRLTGFMHSRETAARMNARPTGSARAYAPADEPLVRMRNTAILPGRSSLDDMIAGVEDGYFLMKTANGQADSTTEFMFGISLAYEIREGRLGRAIRDTTVSGSAIKVLQSVDAVGSEMDWSCAGYCGKKQPMVVSMGGPALRARVHLGGE